MADPDMKEQKDVVVPVSDDVTDDVKDVKEEAEIPKPLSPPPVENNTITPENDVNLTDVALVPSESDEDEDQGEDGDGDGDVGVVDHSDKKNDADEDYEEEEEQEDDEEEEEGDIGLGNDADGKKNGNVGVVEYSDKKIVTRMQQSRFETGDENPKKRKTWLLNDSEADEDGTPREQEAFLREVATFHRENLLEFKAPKFYQLPLNILKLWRAVIKLGGYEVVTTSKLWRQVGESFNPPKTCTTVSYTFRIFYEKALLEYENYMRKNGEIDLPGSAISLATSIDRARSNSGTGRARRDSAVRAMQGWHSQGGLFGSGEATEPAVKERGSNSIPKPKKFKTTVGLQRHTTHDSADVDVSLGAEQSADAKVVDIGPLADWVKINVKETRDAFEIFALVPGLLRNEIRIQSDPAGRMVLTGQPEQLDNPWGITPFKKIVELSARIDPIGTSAVMSMHGRLFIRVPYEKQ